MLFDLVFPCGFFAALGQISNLESLAKTQSRNEGSNLILLTRLTTAVDQDPCRPASIGAPFCKAAGWSCPKVLLGRRPSKGNRPSFRTSESIPSEPFDGIGFPGLRLSDLVPAPHLESYSSSVLPPPPRHH